MWIYIPDSPGSTPSPSAPEAEGSTSDSIWQCLAIAPSLTWRGRHSPAPIWSRRCARVSWLRRLCGAMPDHSRADSFAAAWIASLEASRVSRIPSPASGADATTSATSGRRSAASSSSPERGARSSKMCPAWSPRAGSNASGETYAGWVSRLRQDSSVRQRSARAMAANGCSCSRSTAPPSPGIWPTATANDFKGSGPTLMRRDGKMRGDRLDYAAEQFWSTPRASDGEKGGPNQSFGAGGVPLPAMASRWPTPGASRTNNDVGLGAAGAWPTIRAAEAGAYQYSRGDKTRPVPTLTGAVSAWTTLVDGLSSPPRRATGYGPPSRASICAAYRRYRATTCLSLRAEMRALIRMAIRAERAGQRRGFTRPSFRKSLNPRFVTWLMGWPDHWTQIASTPCACSATELSLWQRRMRCALSALPWPGDMTPIQPDLFGG